MRRLMSCFGLVALTLSIALGVTTPTAAADGNAANAKACQKGGWEDLQGTDGTLFTSQDACVAYGAHGGTLEAKPVATATITGVTIFYRSSSHSFQGAAVTGTGFLPNSRITFTVTFATPGLNNYNHLNDSPGVFTDASGAFTSGTSSGSTTTYIYLTCAATELSVEATDGTNTATWEGTLPACA